MPDALVAKAEREKGPAEGLPDREQLQADIAAMTAELGRAAEDSALPAAPAARQDLHDLVVRTRLG